MSLFKKNHLQKETFDRIKKEDISLSDMFISINKRTEIEHLFKSLSRRCHPDLYVTSPEKNALAEDLFKRAMTNRTNYEELVRLDQIVRNELES